MVMDMVASFFASSQHPPADHKQDPIWGMAALHRSLLRVLLHMLIRCQITAEDSICTTERELLEQGPLAYVT